MRTLIVLAALCLPALAQQADRYTVSLSVTLSGSSRTITIAEPTSGGKRIELEQVTAQPYGTGGITLQLERDCSSVTTSSPVTAAAVNSDSAPGTGAKFKVYDSSAASTCTALSPDWVIPDSAMLPIGALGTYKDGTGTSKNFNFRILPLSGSLAGKLRLQVVLREAR